MDQTIYDDLPEEPELAFLYLEEIFHREVTETEERWGQNEPPNSTYIEYMSKILAACRELGLDEFQGQVVPSTGNFEYYIYGNFRHEVVAYRTALQIRYGKRAQGFSVRLDAKAKQTIHFHVGQIRELINTTPLDDRKRERLIDKLVAFESEVDRDRTRFESFGAAVVEFAGVLGDAAEELEPARRLLDSIARLIWGAKDDENKRLPPPPTRKRIEPPKSGSKSLADELDDDIPF